jgi:hypothetical protein
MFRRNVFVVVVLLGLIFSTAFTSWTQVTSRAGNSSPASVKSWPPDLAKHTRPAIPGDVIAKPKGAAGFLAPGFFVVDIPNSSGGEPDIAINPTNPNQIVVHAGFGGWNGNAPNEISNDGGLTWNQASQIPPPPGAPNTSGCPCDIAQDYGLDGNLYGTYLTGGTGSPPADIFSASNTTPFSGGLFNYFLLAGNAQLTDFNSSLGNSDQPWLLTNRDPSNANQTNAYVGYSDFFDDGTVNERVSAALGTQPPNFATDNLSGVSTGGGINPGHRVTVDPRTGAIYSLYQVCLANCGTNQTIGYNLNRSMDAGATWTLNGSGTGIQVASGLTVQANVAKFGTVNALLGGIDHAAVDPTTGNVYVAFGGDNGVVDPTSGLDGNAIFIKEITFDNSTSTNAILTGVVHQVSLPGAEAALPSVAVAGDGTVGVLYTSFDGFSVDGFPIFTAHFAFSTDAGATFTDQKLLTFLSPVTSDDSPANNDRQRVLGDYQQLKVVPSLQPFNPPGSANTGSANAGATFYGVFTGNNAALGGATANNDAIFFKVTMAPQINLNPNPVSIGNVCKGSTGSAELEVSDTGADNLLISSIAPPVLLTALTSPGQSQSTDIALAPGPTFPVNISPDAHFDFTFTCTPTTFGSKSATFTIASNDPASPSTPVTVTCTTASGKAVATGSGNLGTSVCGGATPANTITVNNVGGCNLNLLNAVTSCADFTLVNPPTFPVAISPDSGIGLTVQFTPTSAGPKSCNLTITTDDPNNPTIVVPLTGTTQLGSASLTLPAGLTFPPTVIQQRETCSSQLGVPITNGGACPLQITAVGFTQSGTPPDYSMAGLPGLPVTIPAGGQLGAGNLDVVFAPNNLTRTSTGTVDVTFVNDPITGATTTEHVPLCGEAVHRGVRVLVTDGGVPVDTVAKIVLQNARAPEQSGGVFNYQVVRNAALQTVEGEAPCPTFSFHAEFGGVSDPFQLKDGTYRIKATIKVGNKTLTKRVRFVEDPCTFNSTIVVPF